jgi:hypothetical protein
MSKKKTVVNALLNEFIELPEDEAESIAIDAVENFIAEKQFKGEQQSDLERGN